MYNFFHIETAGSGIARQNTTDWFNRFHIKTTNTGLSLCNKVKAIHLLFFFVLAAGCSKDDGGGLPLPPDPVEPEIKYLREASGFPIGVAVQYPLYLNDAAYAAIVNNEFNQVSFEYHMKHGAIVQNDGNLKFTSADALMNALGNKSIHGHTLAWHSNQNATYLKSLTSAPTLGQELLYNPGFELGMAAWSIYNSGNPPGSASLEITQTANEVFAGKNAIKIVNPTAYPGAQWRVQLASRITETLPGKDYMITYYAKVSNAVGSIRLSSQDTTGANAQYQADQPVGTSWTKISWQIKANSSTTRILVDMGQAANTYFIDEFSVKEITGSGTDPEAAKNLVAAMTRFIDGTVNHFKSKVRSWDVVNEPFADNPVAIRNNTNTNTSPADVFVWSHYLGRDWAFTAFKLAEAADPAAELYINEYNLEINNTKLDSVIAFAKELKTKGAKVDGIGTQMHLSWNTPQAGIDRMFQKLAATGLKVKVTELDIRAMANRSEIQPNETILNAQANMAKYILQSYFRNVPSAQRGGITIWGVNDKNSWLYENGKEFPLMWDNNYGKKPFYQGVMEVLKANK